MSALIVISSVCKYIDGSCYIVQNHRYQEALERLGGVAVLYKEELFDSVLCIRVCVCACVRVCVCGYKFKRRVS